MNGLLQRAAALAQAARQRRLEAVAREWRERVSGADVTMDASHVVVAAKRLGKRLLTDLRFVGRGGR